MRKGNIEIVLAKDDRVFVDAYISDDPPGLAVHRVVEWVPAKNEHKHTSKWVVTHIASGLMLFGQSGYLDTKRDAVALVKMLSSIDWVDTPIEDLRLQGQKVVSDALHQLRSGILTADEEEPEAPRYIVRRARGIGYEVIDTETDSAVASFAHRGLASQRAKELKGRVST